MKVEFRFLMKRKCLPVAAVWVGLAATALAQQPQSAQLPSAPEPNLPVTRLAGDVVVERARPGALPLSIDEAIDRGLQRNVAIMLDVQNQRSVHGQVLQVKNNL